MATLNILENSAVQKKYPLNETPIIIGRHPRCDIQVDDASVSRQHAKITSDGGHFYIQDLNSRNGTLLNGSPVVTPTKIYDTAEIQICDVVFVFSHAQSSPETDAPTAVDRNDSADDNFVAKDTLKPNYDDSVSSVKDDASAPAGRHSQVDKSSVFLDDFIQKNASVKTQLDIPSHHQKVHRHASAEQKLNAITQIAHALSESVERDHVFQKILDFLLDLFVQADRGFIILKNADGSLDPVGVQTRGAANDEQIRISRTIVNQVIEGKRAILSTDVASDDRFDMSQSIVDFRIRSMLCAPMINSKDEAIGVIQLDTVKQNIAFDDEDLETLGTVAMQASLAVQKSDLFDQAKRADLLKVDLQVANEIQRKFLPQRTPQIEHYDFFSYYSPMQQVGGDYFDYVCLGDGRIGIVVADVVGHGIAAALLMAKISAESRFALATSKTAVEAVAKMNESMVGLQLDRFVTLVLGLVDSKNNTVTFVNAGHMPPILRTANGQFKQLAIDEAGIPLGIMEGYEYESIDVPLTQGDVVIMYTDGINEAMNDRDEQLTTRKLIEELEASQAKTAKTIGDQIIKTVARHAGNTSAIDDKCVVCVERKN
jgi:serine phosphatase RsbU (regulator of sigma subunit)/pSer/pThr/pTyr-binding forkhead associated (FHA) protein